MKPVPGKLLTHEQSVRLALAKGPDRQRIIEIIVKRIRELSNADGGTKYQTPASWYRGMR